MNVFSKIKVKTLGILNVLIIILPNTDFVYDLSFPFSLTEPAGLCD